MIAKPKAVLLEKFANAVRDKDLRPNPQYQRGAKWTIPQKQALIDSLLRGYHIPLIYIHVEERETSLGDKNTARWVIDGQQRLNAVTGFIRGDFPLGHPSDKSHATEVYLNGVVPPWAGKRFKELDAADRKRLLEAELSTVEISDAKPGEVEDLFVRLQGGTPLSAQEKRDAWPGDFTIFVIRYAGRPDHPESDPSPFFALVKKKAKKRKVEDEDDFHFIDPLVDTRKLFAQIAMNIVRRHRDGIDFVDGSGRAVNAFYVANVKVSEDDAAVQRVLRVLDAGAVLTGLYDLKPMNANLVFHFAMLLDTLISGPYVQDWRGQYCQAFAKFVHEVQQARDDFRKERRHSLLYDDFVVPLAGSGSDKAEWIRRRHAVFADWMRNELKVKLKDPKRLFDVLEREIVWGRDGRTCKNPTCGKEMPFSEATVHHVTEHSAGGLTKMSNAVLVCKCCAPKRTELQAAEKELKKYLHSLRRTGSDLDSDE